MCATTRPSGFSEVRALHPCSPGSGCHESQGCWSARVSDRRLGLEAEGTHRKTGDSRPEPRPYWGGRGAGETPGWIVCTSERRTQPSPASAQ